MRHKTLAVVVTALILAAGSLVLVSQRPFRDKALSTEPISTTPSPTRTTEPELGGTPAAVQKTSTAQKSAKRRTLASDSHVYMLVEASNPLFLSPTQLDAIQEAYNRASLAKQKLELSLAEVDAVSSTSTYIKIPPYEAQANAILDRFYQDVEEIAGSLVSTKFKQHYDSDLRALSNGFGSTERHLVMDRIEGENRVRVVDSISRIAPGGNPLPSTIISDLRPDDLQQYAYFKDFVPSPKNQ